MQAHPLSTTAARISSSIASPSLPPTLSVILPWPAPSPAQKARDSAAPKRILIAEDAGLAHDAGNLLSALYLYSDLLGAPGVLDPAHQHYATELGLIAARSSALIRRLFSEDPHTIGPLAPASAVSATSASADDPLLMPLPESPGAALRALAPVLRRVAAGAATVSVSTPKALPTTTLPAEVLERIAVNLVCNAAEAIRASQRSHATAATLHSTVPLQHGDVGHIRITLDVFGGALRLTVEDNGPGMPPAVAAAFLRPGSMPANAGRGLGHRIVHELVETTGGQLSVRVRPGRGTTLCVRWPLASVGVPAEC